MYAGQDPRDAWRAEDGSVRAAGERAAAEGAQLIHTCLHALCDALCSYFAFTPPYAQELSKRAAAEHEAEAAGGHHTLALEGSAAGPSSGEAACTSRGGGAGRDAACGAKTLAW